MKKIRQSVSMFAVFIALSIPLASVAYAQSGQTPSTAMGPMAQPSEAVAMPSPEALTVLVQAALGTLNDANLTGDYSVLLKKSSAGFKGANTEGDLLLGFAQFKEQEIDLSASIIYPIVWSQAPMIEGQSLRLIGAVDSRPQAILFDLGFILEEGKWKLAAISVGLSAPAK